MENASPPAKREATVYIREYRVLGTKLLQPLEVEKAVYPFLGPERTTQDVDQARAALEKVYHDKGYQTVVVEVPQQNGRGGIVYLKVAEATVGRLRVRDARFFLPSDIKSKAPSLAEGKVPNFNEVTKDIIALNTADRRVTPKVNPGVEPGTVDVDLIVKDTFPMHGSIELNNRHSQDTVPLRLNGSFSYGNLWQLEHSAGVSFQVAPERPSDALVYTGYYLMPVPGVDGLALMFSGTHQDSDVSTLGGAAVAGRGNILSLRAVISLAPHGSFYQSLSVGMDYKHFDEKVVLGADTLFTPVDYYPVSFNYGASYTGNKSYTEFNSSVNFAFRGLGSQPDKFDNKRYLADGAYFYVRGDLSHTQDLPGGFQAYAKLQGQLSDSPLINSEQYAGGGLNSVRGYLESAALGDSGGFGTFELRSPSFFGRPKDKTTPVDNEWRVYGFFDGGHLMLNEPLPEQKDRYDLASFGVGSRMKLFGHLNASADAGWPLVTQGSTLAHDVFVTFRFWADF